MMPATSATIAGYGSRTGDRLGQADPQMDSFEADRPRVLVVDDEAVIIEEIAEYLGLDGIAVTGAADAGAATHLLAEAPPGAFTVVLTDIRMPGRDGITFARDILAGTTDETALEVIVMTGHGALGNATDPLRSRVFDFVTKPVPLNDLAGIVRRAHQAAMERRQGQGNRQPIARLQSPP